MMFILIFIIITSQTTISLSTSLSNIETTIEISTTTMPTTEITTPSTTKMNTIITNMVPEPMYLKCYDLSTCNNQGTCLPTDMVINDNELCECGNCYVTYHDNSGNYPMSDGECNYKQRSQTLIFCMTFFFGLLGVGDFIAGNIALGIIPYILFGIAFIASIIVACCGAPKAVGGVISCLYCVAYLIYWIVQLCGYGIPTYTDGNGVALCQW